MTITIAIARDGIEIQDAPHDGRISRWGSIVAHRFLLHLRPYGMLRTPTYLRFGTLRRLSKTKRKLGHIYKERKFMGERAR